MNLHESPNTVHTVRVIEELTKLTSHKNFPFLKVQVNDMESPPLLLIYDRTWVNITYYLIVRSHHEYWNEERELKYLDIVKNGRARMLINDKELMSRMTRETIQDDEESELTVAELHWTEAEREVGVFYRIQGLFNDVFSSFNALADLQGQYVPRLHAHWYLKVHDYEDEMLQQPSLLIEDVVGFNLVDLFNKAPESAWCDIGDKVLEVVNLISDRGVLNMWYTLNSFTIHTQTDEDGTVTYIPVMTDLGSCRTRRHEENEEQWRLAKRCVDEEGQLGLQLVTMFEDAGHEYSYRLSFRYHRSKPEMADYRLVKYRPYLNKFSDIGLRTRTREGGYTLDCPYREGSIIELIVTNSVSISAPTSSKISARVVKLFQPVTISPVMLVEVEGECRTMILKLFDRRCCPRLRDIFRRDWNEDVEDEYKSFIESGEADNFKPYYGPRRRFGESLWSVAQDEKWLYDKCRNLYSTEVRAYESLSCIQGRNIPKLFATVTLKYETCSKNEYQKFFEAPGILMEYIEGINLMDIFDHLDSSFWVSIVESARSLVGRIWELNFFNDDVHPSHVIVRKVNDHNEPHYEPVMIDFALGEIRGAEVSDEDWHKAKCYLEEENTIGQMMYKMFRIKGHEWCNNDIRRYFRMILECPSYPVQNKEQYQ